MISLCLGQANNKAHIYTYPSIIIFVIRKGHENPFYSQYYLLSGNRNGRPLGKTYLKSFMEFNIFFCDEVIDSH